MTHALVYSILLLFSEIMTRAQRLKIMFCGALQKNHSRVLTEQLSKHLVAHSLLKPSDSPAIECLLPR